MSLENRHVTTPSAAHAVTDPRETNHRGSEGVEPGEAPGAAGEPDGLYVSASVVPDVLDGDRAAAAPSASNRFRIVASTEDIDSHGTKLKQNWNLARFTANPVLQWSHNRSEDRPAIGTVEGLAVKKKQLAGEAVFDTTTEFDREILAKYQKRILRGFSVGFRANKYTLEIINDEEILVLDDLELFEISACNVPSNPNGLTVDQEKRNADTLGRMMSRARAAQFIERAGAVPFVPHPTSKALWNAALAERRVRAWATTNGTLDFAKYAEAFAYSDPDKRSDPSGYRFLHSDVESGKLVTVKSGVLEAMRAVKSCGLPEADLAAVKRHIASNLDLFGLQPSWARQAGTPSTPQPAPTRSTPGVPMSLKSTDNVTDTRATAKGMTCKVGCPSCEESFELDVKVSPLATDKAAEFTQLSSDLSARTVELAKVTSDLLEARALKTADESQITALRTQATALSADLTAARASIAGHDIDALIGTKLAPTERASQLVLAEMFMAKADDGVAWKAHLDGLRGRPDMRIISAPVVGVDPTRAPGADPVKNPDAARDAFDGSDDAGYSALLAERMKAHKASVTA